MTGKSRTKSGVCFCLIVTRCSQKSRLDRKPPRTAFSSWTATSPATDCADVRRSQMFRLLAKIPPLVLGVAPRLEVEVLLVLLVLSSSPSTICSLDAQLDCRRNTLPESSFERGLSAELPDPGVYNKGSSINDVTQIWRFSGPPFPIYVTLNWLFNLGFPT